VINIYLPVIKNTAILTQEHQTTPVFASEIAKNILNACFY